MNTFFRQTAQAMTAKHIGRFPLSELDQVIDWQPIETIPEPSKNPLPPRPPRPPRPSPVVMFKAVLPGQWHSLSDPELEHSLITRIGFNLFCRFDEPGIPGCSTLCRYRKFRYAREPISGCSKWCAKPPEGDVFEPVESRQQAKCARCRLKGGPDA